MICECINSNNSNTMNAMTTDDDYLLRMYRTLRLQPLLINPFEAICEKTEGKQNAGMFNLYACFFQLEMMAESKIKLSSERVPEDKHIHAFQFQHMLKLMHYKN